MINFASFLVQNIHCSIVSVREAYYIPAIFLSLQIYNNTTGLKTSLSSGVYTRAQSIQINLVIRELSYMFDINLYLPGIVFLVDNNGVEQSFPSNRLYDATQRKYLGLCRKSFSNQKVSSFV